MQVEMASIKKDLEHVKETTDKIEGAVSALLEKIADNGTQVVELRGRVRELEHEYIDSKDQFKAILAQIEEQNAKHEAALEKFKTFVWKLFSALVAGGSGALSLWEVFGK